MQVPGRAFHRLGVRRAGWLVAAPLLAACWLLPGPARAQCTPDAMDPSMVECTGNDPDGFEAGVGVNDVTVRVRTGATVSNGAATNTIGLNDDSTLLIEPQGTVSNDAVGGTAASLGVNASVSHAGAIQVSGDGGTGIAAQDGSDLITFVGSSIVLMAPNTTGIDASADSAVEHFGGISGDQMGSVGIRLVGSDGQRASLFGTISLDGDLARGVELSGNCDPMTPPEDCYLLTNLGSITVIGVDSVGVLGGVGGSDGNLFVNAGTITAEEPGTGPAVSFAPSGTLGTNIFENFGDVVAGSGTALLGGAGKDVVRLFDFSQVTGLLDLAGGDDELELFGGLFTSAEGGAGANDVVRLLAGTIPFNALDLSTVTGFETLELESGDWTLSGAGSFSGGATLRGGVARFDVPASLVGDLTLTENATAGTQGILEVSDTLSVTGAYSQDAGATLRPVLDPSGASGSVAVSGVATLGGGALLEIVEASPFGDTASFTLLSATGGIVGDFVGAPPNTAVLTFALSKVNMDQDIVLDVVRSPYADAASTRNQRAVAAALDVVRQSAPGTDMQQVLVALDRTPVNAYGGALDSLHSEAYDAHTSSALWLGRGFARLAARNVVECEPAYYQHVPHWIGEGRPCDAERWTPWFGSFGGVRERDTGGGGIQYSGQGAGFAVGAARSLGGGWELSGHLGGGFGWLGIDGFGDGQIQVLDLGLATVRRLGALSVRSVLDYGHGWHEQDRNVVVGSFVRTATGSFQSDRVTGLLEAGYGFPDAGPLVIEPVASLDFTWLREEGFTESGAQAASLVVDERSHTVFGTSLGLRLRATLVKHRYVLERIQWANGVWRPELDLRWRGDWTDVDRDLSDRLSGAPGGTGSFRVQAADTAHGADISAGVTFQPYGSQALVHAGYRGFVGDGAQDHALDLSVRIPF